MSTSGSIESVSKGRRLSEIMNAKQALTVLVILLAAAICTYSVVLSRAATSAPAATDTAGPAPAGSAGPGENKIVAYYFHVTVRCNTCHTIERYSKESLDEYFSGELASGKIEWRPVNVQLSENRHFVKDYKLFTRSLVLVLVQDGRQRTYKVLERTWDLVGQEKFFKQYVKKEVEKYLRKLT